LRRRYLNFYVRVGRDRKPQRLPRTGTHNAIHNSARNDSYRLKNTIGLYFPKEKRNAMGRTM